MAPDESKIKNRLNEVLNAIFSPVTGCWPLHGCHFQFYHDGEAYVIEVWPVAIEEEDDHEGNGHARTDKELLYEFAAFDFVWLTQNIPVEDFHFDQQRQVFDIAWMEDGHPLELRAHIEPVETE